MQPQNFGLPFRRTAGDIAGPLPVTEEGSRYRKNVKGYHDGLQEKLPSIHKMLHHKNRVAIGRKKTRYDLRDNSVGFQAGDLVWLYNPRRRNGRCSKLSSDREGPYTIVTKINDVVYRIRQGPKINVNIVHLGRLMKYDSDTIDVSDRHD